MNLPAADMDHVQVVADAALECWCEETRAPRCWTRKRTLVLGNNRALLGVGEARFLSCWKRSGPSSLFDKKVFSRVGKERALAFVEEKYCRLYENALRFGS